MLFARTRDVAAKTHTILRGSKMKAMRIAGQTGTGVCRKEPDLIAVGTERESAAARVEVALVKREESKSWNDGIIGNTEFLRSVRIIAEEPPAHIHGASRGVEQLHSVGWRGKISSGERFVNPHRGNCGWSGVIRAWRTVQGGARTPTRTLIPAIEGRIGIRNHEGEAEPIGNRIPTIAIIEIEDFFP